MPKRDFENPLLSTRHAAIHAKFNPEGGKSEDVAGLRDLWIEVQHHVNREHGKELRKKEREQREFQDAVDKLMPIVQAVMEGKQDAEKSSDEVFRRVPDESMRTKVFDLFSKIIEGKVETRSREEIDTASRRIAASDKAIKTSNTILNALIRLSEAAEAGDEQAAEALLRAATSATVFLASAAHRNPERFKKLAGMTNMWPVMAENKPGWEKSAVEEMNELGLGEKLAFLKTRLRPVRGSDVALPARRWAKCAIRTIDETRWRFPLFVGMIRDLGGTEAWVSFASQYNWDIRPFPDWVKPAMALKEFSVATFDDWKVVVREIIREQTPDFHLRPEWVTQRATAAANGRTTPGEIQNAILDDIVSALKRLAPDKDC